MILKDIEKILSMEVKLLEENDDFEYRRLAEFLKEARHKIRIVILQLEELGKDTADNE